MSRKERRAAKQRRGPRDPRSKRRRSGVERRGMPILLQDLFRLWEADPHKTDEIRRELFLNVPILAEKFPGMTYKDLDEEKIRALQLVTCGYKARKQGAVRRFAVWWASKVDKPELAAKVDSEQWDRGIADSLASPVSAAWASCANGYGAANRFPPRSQKVQKTLAIIHSLAPVLKRAVLDLVGMPVAILVEEIRRLNFENNELRRQLAEKDAVDGMQAAALAEVATSKQARGTPALGTCQAGGCKSSNATPQQQGNLFDDRR